jgi:hypothetical protein
MYFMAVFKRCLFRGSRCGLEEVTVGQLLAVKFPEASRHVPLLEAGFQNYFMSGRRWLLEEKFKKVGAHRRKFVEAQSM